MLNNSQGSQGNNDLQTAQNAIAILIDQITILASLLPM